MTHTRPGQRPRRRWPLLAALIVVVAACGDDTATESGSADDTRSEESSSTSSSTTSSSTTPATSGDAPAGPWEPYIDGENDCERNRDHAPAPMCMPPDIDTVSITRAGPLTIVTTFHAPVTGVDWQLTLGFDLDDDPTTGITDGIWSEDHGIGPDLEFDYLPDNDGTPFAQINEIAPGPVFTLVEAGDAEKGPLAVWTWLDDRTLQVVISDTLVPDDASGFPVAGQTMHPDYHDAVPDDGPLPWP